MAGFNSIRCGQAVPELSEYALVLHIIACTDIDSAEQWVIHMLALTNDRSSLRV